MSRGDERRTYARRPSSAARDARRLESVVIVLLPRLVRARGPLLITPTHGDGSAALGRRRVVRACPPYARGGKERAWALRPLGTYPHRGHAVEQCDQRGLIRVRVGLGVGLGLGLGVGVGVGVTLTSKVGVTLTPKPSLERRGRGVSESVRSGGGGRTVRGRGEIGVAGRRALRRLVRVRVRVRG